ncbi:hypothetical protein P43SY_006114 [Pythium insidiosum]|uniref:Uncharacterized protein n=1 Tax=Pythium insidiosum TaxID=114742 RepID=A0AAD5M0U2_PYTIN|nr:hypothetical protein P43SY_006114 [Pythium insidiosum]
MSSGDEKPVEHATADDSHAADATSATTPSGRVRRTTQKFGFDEKQNDEEEEFKPPVGSGTKVKDMEVVSEKISHMGKKDAETLKSLYNIMYSRRFQLKNMRSIKEHILEFSGIPNGDDKVRQQLVQKIGRWMRSYLQDIMDVLGIVRQLSSELGKDLSSQKSAIKEFIKQL